MLGPALASSAQTWAGGWLPSPTQWAPGWLFPLFAPRWEAQAQGRACCGTLAPGPGKAVLPARPLHPGVQAVWQRGLNLCSPHHPCVTGGAPEGVVGGQAGLGACGGFRGCPEPASPERQPKAALGVGPACLLDPVPWPGPGTPDTHQRQPWDQAPTSQQRWGLTLLPPGAAGRGGAPERLPVELPQ